MQVDVFVILVNYNTAEETLACVESLKQLQGVIPAVVVVDNASSPQDVQKLHDAKITEMVHLIENTENLGYSGGNNVGIRYAMDNGAKFIWLLNNDTTVNKDSLHFLLEEARWTPCLTGSMICNMDGTYQQVGTDIDRWTGHVQGLEEGKLIDGMHLPSICFASVMIPRSVIEQIGLLDEDYFLYFEDVDYCWTAKKAGIDCKLAFQSTVYHKEGASTGKHSLLTYYYYQRNRMLLLFRHSNVLERSMSFLYGWWRLNRSRLKGLVGDVQDKRRAKVHRLAFEDFVREVTGPCPHDLEAL